MNKLGVIPVYFFLTILFGDQDYPGPYNNLEKGLLILYFIIKNINIQNKINSMDCIALDGGYTLYINNIINNSDLNDYNFVCPIRKDLGIHLNETELNYNDQFGGFRSKMEKCFANIGHMFERLNNNKSFITTDINIFNIQIKIASVLLNIKNYVELNKIEIFDFHTYWLNEGYDFEYNDYIIDNINIIKVTQPKISERITKLETMRSLQQQFIGLQIQNNQTILQYSQKVDTMDMELNNHESFEVENILDHKGLVVEDSMYLVKWKNYTDEENQWLHYSRFDEYKIIDEYWKRQSALLIV
ncbi:hypothetical protein BDF21DRAFT_332706 [Thamnidium elegans]|nr:hypothetical protein BDF21DRAFT_332706 [Thamnidium elegans]